MFLNRSAAGNQLFQKLQHLKLPKAIIFAIPRGGIIVGYEMAKRLHLPLHVVVVKKVGAPKNSELAIGAVASSGITYIDGALALRIGVDQETLDTLLIKKRREVKEREKEYRIKNPRSLKNHTVILTDDGIATGATVKAAIKYLKKRSAKKIILAVPVIARDTYDDLKSEVDLLIALDVPESFGAVGQFYREFEQVTDEEVIKILSN